MLMDLEPVVYIPENCAAGTDCSFFLEKIKAK